METSRIAEVSGASTKIVNFTLLLDVACGTVNHWAHIPVLWHIGGTQQCLVQRKLYKIFTSHFLISFQYEYEKCDRISSDFSQTFNKMIKRENTNMY